MTTLIAQIEENITLDDKTFPAQFLLDKGFPELAHFQLNQKAVQATNLVIYDTHSTYSDGKSVVGELLEVDRLHLIQTWFKNAESLYQEYQNSLPEEPIADIEESPSI